MNPLQDSVSHLPQLRVLPLLRCTHRCFYCRPTGEGINAGLGETLSAEQVITVSNYYARLGGIDIKFSGGDPVLWAPLVEVIRAIHSSNPSIHLEVLSRDPRLGPLATSLASAGTSCLNMSLDTLSPERHKAMTGIDDHKDVIAAVSSCVSSGVPTKINVVVSKINEIDLIEILTYAEEVGVGEVKYLDLIKDLHFMGQHEERSIDGSLIDYYLPLDKLEQRLSELAISRSVRYQGGFGHPLVCYEMASGLKAVLKDSRKGAWYSEACSSCTSYPCHDALMALRLVPGNKLQTCLLQQNTLHSINKEGIEHCFQEALAFFSKAVFVSRDHEHE
jgi:GTP 3',8-cyclase